MGDNILKKNIKEFAQIFEKSEVDATVLLCEVDNPTQFGIADVDELGNITKIMEKPKDPPTNLAVTGIYFLTPKIFDIIDRLKPSWRNELEITDAIQGLIDCGRRVSAQVITGWWKDTGKPEDLLDANRLVLDQLIENDEGAVRGDVWK